MFSSITYTLTTGVEDLQLSSTEDINATGNALNNMLTGGAGANRLNGLAGADIMRGLGGDDRYYIDNPGDIAFEVANAGTDRVLTSVNYTLFAGSSIELFTTSNVLGTGAINLTGNSFAQTIVGNNGANRLNGRGGADRMDGWGGDDLYIVDNAGDVVIERANAGSDRVLASVSYSLAAGQSIELITTNSVTGTNAINLFGNELGQRIAGNNGTNTINGRGGDDVINGWGGNDTLLGAEGNDTLNGGLGNDSFRFHTALNAATNVDEITDFSVPDDRIQLEDAIFTLLGGVGTLASAAFHIGASAADASDRIIYDSLTGALSYDEDGLGGDAATLFATLGTGLAMTNADFVVI